MQRKAATVRRATSRCARTRAVWLLALAMAVGAAALALTGCATEPRDEGTETASGEDGAAAPAEQVVLFVSISSLQVETGTDGAAGEFETWDRSLWRLAGDGTAAERVEGYELSGPRVLVPVLSPDGETVAFSGETTGRPELGAAVGWGLRLLDIEAEESTELTIAAVLDLGWDGEALIVVVEDSPPSELPGGEAFAYDSSPRILRWSGTDDFQELADTRSLRSAGVTYTPVYLGSDEGTLYVEDSPQPGVGWGYLGGGGVWELPEGGPLTRLASLAAARGGLGASEGDVWQSVLRDRSRTTLMEGLLPIETGTLAVGSEDVGTFTRSYPERAVEVFRAENLNLVRSIEASYPTDATLPSAPVFDAMVTRYLAIEERAADGETGDRTCWIVETDGVSGERSEIVPVPCPGSELPWVQVVGYAGTDGDFLYVTQEGAEGQAGLTNVVVTRFDRSEGVTETVLTLESDPGETWSSVDVRILGP